MQIPPVAAELIYADRRRGHDETKWPFVILRSRLQKNFHALCEDLNPSTHFSVLSYVEKVMWETGRCSGRGHFCSIVMWR